MKSMPAVRRAPVSIRPSPPPPRAPAPPRAALAIPASRAEALVVAPDARERRSLAGRVARACGRVREEATTLAAREALGSRAFDVVVATLRQRDGTGFDVLSAVAERQPEAAVVLLAANPSDAFVRDATRLGAFACLAAPADPDDLEACLRNGIEVARLRREVGRLHRLRGRGPGPGAESLLGDSPPAVALRDAVRAAARGEVAVLLEGEAGSGKRTAARAIHEESGRPGPFVAVCCARPPPRLAEELFGRVPGDGDGPADRVPGLLEAAHGGTVYLEAVDRLTPDVQERLLALLGGRGLRRSAGTADARVDVRLVAGTERDLLAAPAQGWLREDFLAALRGAAIRVPPLRDRAEDVPLLARHFAERAAARRDRPAPALSDAAATSLSARRWPGNVRELRLAAELAVLCSEGDRLGAGDFPEPAASRAGLPLPDEGMSVDDVVDGWVRQAVLRTGWNLTSAARLLGLTRDQMRYRTARLGMRRGEELAPCAAREADATGSPLSVPGAPS